MITQLKITNNTETPLRYINGVFKNDTEFDFVPGINIIVGKNGSGKSTLLKLLSVYGFCRNHFVSDESEISNLYGFGEKEIYSGVEVYGDYELPMFNSLGINDEDQYGDKLGLNNGIKAFTYLLNCKNSSQGESNMLSIQYIIEKMFCGETYPMPKVPELDKFKVSCEHKITLLLDEPDKNLDIYNLKEIRGILSNIHPDVQIIAAIHNPLLIWQLQKVEGINWIELTKHYLKDLKKEFV